MTTPEVEMLKNKLEYHSDYCSREFGKLASSLVSVKRDMKKLSENHLDHLERDVTKLKTDLVWLKKIQWFGLTTSISTLLGIAYLILTKNI